jgi:hypothetical protein
LVKTKFIIIYYLKSMDRGSYVVPIASDIYSIGKKRTAKKTHRPKKCTVPKNSAVAAVFHQKI